jgi:hypothetical protein
MRGVPAGFRLSRSGTFPWKSGHEVDARGAFLFGGAVHERDSANSSTSIGSSGTDSVKLASQGSS